ncbi:MAG: helix-turn-helix domain-containing protein [Chloroflexi bacterium]|nr:MAG: helix-turn-helix domain-containing protein [Chloroflexota bacterium]TMD83558.1 MAG: helix-turn-helix domain-containing protein [Chloroflexota bacterium]
MSDKLLTTREASTFLRVSEASVRRWADAGILTASRVGRRRARRFREADLLQFMQPGQRGPASAPGVPRAIVIQGMAVSLGSHLVSFYSSDAGRLRVGLPFLRDGLLSGQACLMYVTAPLRDHYLKALGGERVDVDAAISTGLLTFMSTHRQSTAGWIAEFERLVANALRDHPGPVRFLGETVTGLQNLGSVQELLTLEQQLGPVMRRLPVVMLCPYDVRTFDGLTIVEALKLHFDTYSYQLASFLS